MSVLCPQCGAPANESARHCEYCGAALQAEQPQQSAYQPQVQPQAQPQVVYVNNERANWPVKSKVVAVVLAILLGGLGIHHFYLGKTGRGVLYLLFCWTGIPGIIAFFEGILIGCTSDENFQIKYRCRLQ